MARASGLLAYFTGHRTAASFIMVLMLVLGFAATTQIRSQFFPDVVVNTITVTVGWDGAGPEEIDRAAARRTALTRLWICAEGKPRTTRGRAMFSRTLRWGRTLKS